MKVRKAALAAVVAVCFAIAIACRNAALFLRMQAGRLWGGGFVRRSTALRWENAWYLRRAMLVPVAFLCVLIAGCNAYQTAQKAHDIVAAVVAVAQADLPSLQAAGVFSASDATAAGNYLSLTVTLDGQYQTCINAANGATLNTKSKFLTCLDTFATGLSNPQEMAQLRVMSPKAQQEVQLWITAASVGVSSVIAALGGQPVAAPQVSKVEDRKSKMEQLGFNRRVEAAAGL